jgi:DNA-binding transcriptional MerR regulator
MSTASQKSESAFRTISEVADELGVQQHVLRFWETKFGQIKPLKRGGGRRYYRPEDVALLKRIYTLLYVEGYTIKGVQKLLKGVSKSQVLEEQKRAAPAVQAHGANLPQMQGPAVPVSAPAAVTAETEIPVLVEEVESSVGKLSALQKDALKAVLAELVDMRDQLNTLTGTATANKSNAA